MNEWIEACRIEDIVPGSGVCARVGKHQVHVHEADLRAPQGQHLQLPGGQLGYDQGFGIPGEAVPRRRCRAAPSRGAPTMPRACCCRTWNSSKRDRKSVV